jgi:D-cysteine desulfhydrase/L-cysteate sulfo-lyase
LDHLRLEDQEAQGRGVVSSSSGTRERQSGSSEQLKSLPVLSSAQMRVIREVTERIARFPRVRLACIPTPVHALTRLSHYLGGPQIFIKRDDLTGIAFGGNKVRNLEFRLAEVVASGADTVIVGLDVQSNSARQTVGSCNRLGLRTILVLEGKKPDSIQGNLLVNYLLGAEIYFAATREEQWVRMAEISEHTKRAGRHPFVLNESPMFALGSALAYLESTLETVEQLGIEGVFPDYFYVSSAGKAQAGMVLAEKLFDHAFKIHGVLATSEINVKSLAAEIANDAARRLGLSDSVMPEEIVNFDQFVGEGYGIPSLEGNDAVRIFAKTEGVILDPIYTGKCAAALIDHVRSGRFGSNDHVVFVHTGGMPAIFTHNSLWLGEANVYSGGAGTVVD